MLGQVKRWAYELLLDSPFPDAPDNQPFLVGYFPKRLQSEYAAHMPEHTLRREIIATVAVNHVVNHAGAAFLYSTMGESGASLDAVVGAYVAVERQSGAEAVRARILASGRGAEAEAVALIELENALESMVEAALDDGAAPAQGALDPVLARLNG
jgi:glutamate dehydrogenase